MVVPPKIPGVYIVEKNAFPNSVVEVATAIPVFIGYTESASYKGQTMKGKPVRITSLQEYTTIFGQGHVPTFTLLPKPSAPVTAPLPDTITVGELSFTFDKKPFYLYNSLKLFYQNGGATCYIISAGFYSDAAAPTPIIFTDAIDTLAFEQEPTLILCPDAYRLATLTDYNAVITKMLDQCAKDQSRMAIMDVYDSSISDRTALGTAIGRFREGVGQNNLNYGVAYFPWVKASIVSTNDVDFTYLDGASQIKITTGLDPIGTQLTGYNASANDLKSLSPKLKPAAEFALNNTRIQIHNALLAVSPTYKVVIQRIVTTSMCYQ